MAQAKILVLFIIIALCSLTSLNCGAAFDSKPHVIVETFNKKVSADSRTQNNHSWIKRVSPKKFDTEWGYRYTGQGIIKSTDYLEIHPDDLLVLEYIPEEGEYLITIYSQNPIADEKFFRK